MVQDAVFGEEGPVPPAGPVRRLPLLPVCQRRNGVQRPAEGRQERLLRRFRGDRLLPARRAERAGAEGHVLSPGGGLSLQPRREQHRPLRRDGHGLGPLPAGGDRESERRSVHRLCRMVRDERRVRGLRRVRAGLHHGRHGERQCRPRLRPLHRRQSRGLRTGGQPLDLPRGHLHGAGALQALRAHAAGHASGRAGAVRKNHRRRRDGLRENRPSRRADAARPRPLQRGSGRAGASDRLFLHRLPRRQGREGGNPLRRGLQQRKP